MSKKFNILLAAIAIPIGGIGLFFFLMLVPVFSLYCPSESIGSVPEKTPIPVLTPAYLPEGYSFQRALVKPNEIILRYFDGPDCRKDTGDGLIEISGEKMSPSLNMTAVQYIDKYYEERKGESYTKKHYIFDDSRHAVGTSYSLTEEGEYSILVGDNNTNTLYSVSANMEPDEVAAIARSLHEVK